MAKTGNNAARREMPIKINGRKLTVREIDLDAYGRIENFIKAKYARLFRESAVGMKLKDINKEVMNIIRSSFTTEELQQEMNMPDCIFFVAYLAMEHNPGITLENVGDLLDLSNIGKVSELVNAMAVDEADDDVNPPKATQASP